MTTPRARALEVLTTLFEEEPTEDETAEGIAALVVDRLREHGFVLAPVNPTKAIKRVLRMAVFVKTASADEMPQPRAPDKVWAACLETLTGD